MECKNSLLKDNEYVELIKANYPAIREKQLKLKEDRLKSELLKMEITSLNISDTKYKGKQSRNRVKELQERLEA